MWLWNLSKFYRHQPIWIFFHDSSRMIKMTMQYITLLHDQEGYQGLLSAESTEVTSALLNKTTASLCNVKSGHASGDGIHKKTIPRGQYRHNRTSHSCSCSPLAELSGHLSAGSVSSDNPVFLCAAPQGTQHNLQFIAMQTWLLQTAKKPSH